MGERETRWRHKNLREENAEERNTDKKPGCQGTGGGWEVRMGTWKCRARRQTEPRVQHHHLLSLLPTPLGPQPKQDAVSQTTLACQCWRQRGTAEEIFHISRKTGG